MTATARNALKATLDANARQLPAVDGLYLGGSFGRGIEDDWSDLDYVAVVPAEQIAELVEAWIALIAAQSPIVYRAQRVFPATALVNVITSDWVRCDLYLETADRFQSRAQDRLNVVFERKPLYAALPAVSEVPEVRPDALTAAVEEFLRVLGLVHLAANRADPFTAQWGVALLRDQMRLFWVETSPQAKLSGALTLVRELPDETMAHLRDLPAGGADMATILSAQSNLARRFLPPARETCDQYDARWPGAFVSSTAHVLRGVMDDAFCDWLAQQAT